MLGWAHWRRAAQAAAQVGHRAFCTTSSSPEEPLLGRVKHGGGDGYAGGAVGATAWEQLVQAAAELGAFLVAGVLDGCGWPHGAEDAEEVGVELAAGLRHVHLRD